MFIIYGKKTRREDGGVVGDWCDVCKGAALFKLAHVYTVGHVYYIPLGKGKYIGTSRKCMQCGTVLACDPGAYARTMTVEEASAAGLEQVMRLTNPGLDERLRMQYGGAPRLMPAQQVLQAPQAPQAPPWPQAPQAPQAPPWPQAPQAAQAPPWPQAPQLPQPPQVPQVPDAPPIPRRDMGYDVGNDR